MSCPTSPVRRTQPWPTRATVALHGAPGLLIGFGVFLAGAALAAFLLAAIPTLMSIRRAALAVEATLYTLEREVPDTAAAVRLSSLELSDAIEQVSLLSNDLTQGLHSSAAAVTAAEQNIRQGAQFLNLGVRNAVIPSVKSRIPAAKGAVEAQLKEAAQLQHVGPTVAELARSTRSIAGRIRFGLKLLNTFSRAAATRQIYTQRPAL